MYCVQKLCRLVFAGVVHKLWKFYVHIDAYVRATRANLTSLLFRYTRVVDEDLVLCRCTYVFIYILVLLAAHSLHAQVVQHFFLR